MNTVSCDEQVSLIHAPGLPTIPSPTTCGRSVSSGHVTYRRIEPRLLPHGSSPNGNSGLRHSLAGSPHHTGRIEFLIVRTGRSPPAAPHPVSPRRSCRRLQVTLTWRGLSPLQPGALSGALAAVSDRRSCDRRSTLQFMSVRIIREDPQGKVLISYNSSQYLQRIHTVCRPIYCKIPTAVVEKLAATAGNSVGDKSRRTMRMELFSGAYLKPSRPAFNHERDDAATHNSTQMRWRSGFIGS